MNRLDQRDFARLIGALMGVAIGAMLALALACLLFAPPGGGFDAGRYGTLEWVKSWGHREEREMAFFLFTLIFGGAFSCVGAMRYVGGRRPTVFALVFLACLVPAASFVIGAAIASAGLIAAIYAALALIVLAAAVPLMKRVAENPARVTGEARPRALLESIDRRSISPALLGAICVVVTALFVVPLGAKQVAATIGFDMHMASFMVGPATYSFGDNLLPGIDYFTQYSVGTPWLFSFFLAPTASKTIVNAVWFIITEILFFQVTLLFFLRWLLRSWGWALVVSVICLMLQFTTESPLYAPSSTAARYPLLIVCIALFAHWVRRDFAWTASLALATALSASLFLNTETGIYTCAAVAIAAVVVGPGLIIPMTRTIALGAMTFVLFMVWSLIAFGPGALQILYLLLLLEPLMLYTGGLTAWPIEWLGGYHWLYNIVSPAIALATIGWVLVSVRQPTLPCPRPHLAALAMTALVGLFLTAKFINMSIVALWQVNAIGLVIVIAWWAHALLEQLPAQRSGRRQFAFTIGGRVLAFHRGSPRAAAAFGLALVSLVFLCTIGDARNPSLYAVAAYRTHPTLVNFLLGGPDIYPCPPHRTGCSSTPVSPQDVALIDRLTKPTDRVALLSFQDWPVLIEARRASKFHFLPSAVIFTERQLKESLRDIDLIFLPREPADKLGVGHPDMAPILVPMLRSNFEVVAETPTLLAWRRAGSNAGTNSTNSTRP
jgi:hypothetical protein